MSEPGGDPSSGISSGDALSLPERHPACRRREAQSGSCTERENLDGDAKGKGTSGSNREAESTDAPARGGLLRSSDEAGVMPVERRKKAMAIWIGSTGNGRNPMLNGRRQPSRGGTSRMTRECQVRFCEGFGVKFPGPTRHNRTTFFRGCTSTFANCGHAVAYVRGSYGRVEDGRGSLGHAASLRFPSPLIGRVEDWRVGLGRCSCSLLSRPFVCECHSISTMPRFQSPPRRTQRADFPLYALLFASPQGLWDLSCRGDFRP